MNRFLGLLLLCCCIRYCVGVPYMVLSPSEKSSDGARKKKCFQFLPVALNQEITISYDCPDFIVEEEMQQNEGDPTSSQAASERYKRQQQANLNQKRFGVSISMKQENMEEVEELETSAEKRKRRRGNRHRRKPSHASQGTVFLKEEITDKKGNVTFLSSPIENGNIYVCAEVVSKQQQKNYYKDPIRISIAVAKSKEYDPKAETKLQYNEEQVKHSVTRMETDLESLVLKLKVLQNSNSLIELYERRFHNSSTSMNTSVSFWSIFHILIILVTSVYQIYSFKKFMKQRSII
mmetsp:Transcript_39806/g.45334  ORF Transcript_39806/g.45334 Transcript_39806/m.45334 type:complete len:292 (+) Transcript_39806:209-1084(+)